MLWSLADVREEARGWRSCVVVFAAETHDLAALLGSTTC
jgi:hypothetical protein